MSGLVPGGDGIIRTAVIGFGVSGRVFHSPFIAASPDYSLDAIVTGNPERAAAAARMHPSADILTTIDRLLARSDDLDLVVIGSPPTSHAKLASAAIDAGLDVVVDKPFTVTSVEGRELISRAAGAGRRLTVFQNRRWDGDFLTVQRLVAEGALGDVARFESRFEWWKPTPRLSWKTEATAAAGGGILYDLGTHVIDQALRLFGPVADIHAELAMRRRDGVAEDDAFVALRHASGPTSHLWVNSLAPQFGPRFRVLGTLAGYTTWGLDGQEAALASGESPTGSQFGVTEKDKWGLFGVEGALTQVPTVRGDYGAFYRQLADAILRAGTVPVDPADAVDVLEIIEHIHAHTICR